MFLILRRKLRANLLAATFVTHLRRLVGPVSVPFRADEPMPSRQRPHRSGGSERRSSLHRGEEEEEKTTKTSFISGLTLSGFVFFSCVDTTRLLQAAARCSESRSPLLSLRSEFSLRHKLRFFFLLLLNV